MTDLDAPPSVLDLDDADPALAAALGILPAGPGFRSLAFAIDVGAWLVLVSPAVIGAFMLLGGAEPLIPWILIAAGYVLTLIFGLVQLIAHGRRGVTLGKASMRLRSISVVDYGRPGFWRVVLRALVLWASTLVPVVGPALMFSSSLWDPQRRGRSFLDRIARCWVIDARGGLDPFDAKALRQARRELRGRPDDSEVLPSMATGADAASALRIPDSRSRAGVVGPGTTGAQWQAAVADDLGVIEGVPGAEPVDAIVASPVPAPVPTVLARSAYSPPAASAPAVAPEAPPPAAVAPAVADAPDPGVSEAGVPGTRRARAMVRFDDGSTVRVPALALLGRDPEASEGESVDALLRLDDPERLMSKTHAAFGLDAEGVWVADRGSRNGTQLRSPGGDVVDVPVGAPVRVPLGWSVHVGGRSFELVARGADS